MIAARSARILIALVPALEVTPDNAAANCNMGLLKAEANDLIAAQRHLRAALKADPQMTQAAYNLCVFLSNDRLDEAMDFCKEAAGILPDRPRYPFTLAFYRQQKETSLGLKACWTVSLGNTRPMLMRTCSSAKSISNKGTILRRRE